MKFEIECFHHIISSRFVLDCLIPEVTISEAFIEQLMDIKNNPS